MISQQPLPSQLDLPRRLSSLVSTLTDANHASVSQFELVFYLRERARAVVWEVDARECVRAEILVAVRWDVSV